MDVSIVLVNYNTKELTKECLKSLYKKTKDIVFEVFVVDNASTDGSCEMIKQEFPQVHLIENSDNKGFGAANNIAMKQSKAKYVFLLNTDTILINNSVKILFDFMEQKENEQVGSCGGALFYEDMRPQHSFGRFLTIKRLAFVSLGLHLIFNNFYKKNLWVDEDSKLKEIEQVEYITGADVLFRKEALDKSGYFDEDFFMYAEDVEIAYRLNKNGYSSYVVPEAQIIHLHNASTKKQPLNRTKMVITSHILYFQKTHGKHIKHIVKFFYMIRYLFCFNSDYFKRLLMICSL